MKGMQKISRGTGFRGVFEYLLEDERGHIIGGNLSGTDPRELARELSAVRNLRPDIERPVWHNSLRLPAGERIDDEQWRAISDEYMRRMGFADDHPRAYVMHDDEDGQHIHIVASRVSLSGQVYLGRNENLISTRHIAALEREYELQITKGADLESERARMKKGEIEMGIRTGEAPPKLRLQELIDKAAEGRPGAREFVERLEAAGVTVVPNVASTGRLNGFSFELDGIAFKGSQLGPAYSWTKQLKDKVSYEQDRDFKGLRTRAAAAADRGERADAAAEHRAAAEHAPAAPRAARGDRADHGASDGIDRGHGRESGQDCGRAAPGDQPGDRADQGRDEVRMVADDPRHAARAELAQDERRRVEREPGPGTTGRGRAEEAGAGAGQGARSDEGGRPGAERSREESQGQPVYEVPRPGSGGTGERRSDVDWRARFRRAAQGHGGRGPGVDARAERGHATGARVTESHRQEARAVDPSAYLESRGYTVRRAGSGYSVRDAAGDEQYRIDYDSGRGWLWCDRYGNSGGDNIDLVSEIDGKTGYADAVYRLLGAPTARDLPRQVQRPQIERKPPKLPDYTHNDRVYGMVYLSSFRGCVADTLEAAEAQGLVSYGRDAVYFVGRDKAGNVRSVTERSYERHGRELTGGYKRDLKGSEKRYAPVFRGDPARVLVVEGGADALCAHSAALLKGKEPPTIIITGGAGARSWIDEHRDILARAERVTVMRDREKDPATQARTDAQHEEQERRIAAVTAARVVSQYPPEGYKDIADFVKAQTQHLEVLGIERERERERGMGR